MGEKKQTAAASGGKYLSFSLGKERYGIDILKVKEIIGIMQITPVPHSPDYMKGVINLRGKVIPVLDLRRRFNMPDKEHTERTCIIVVEVMIDHASMVQVGMVVDSVAEVTQIKGEDIEEPPRVNASIETATIRGIAKLNDCVQILLDIDKVMAPQEIAQLTQEAA